MDTTLCLEQLYLEQLYGNVLLEIWGKKPQRPNPQLGPLNSPPKTLGGVAPSNAQRSTPQNPNAPIMTPAAQRKAGVSQAPSSPPPLNLRNLINSSNNPINLPDEDITDELESKTAEVKNKIYYTYAILKRMLTGDKSGVLNRGINFGKKVAIGSLAMILGQAISAYVSLPSMENLEILEKAVLFITHGNIIDNVLSVKEEIIALVGSKIFVKVLEKIRNIAGSPTGDFDFEYDNHRRRVRSNRSNRSRVKKRKSP